MKSSEIGIDEDDLFFERTKIQGNIKQVSITKDRESREYNAYKIFIETDKGRWCIKGSGDQSPWVEKL